MNKNNALDNVPKRILGFLAIFHHSLRIKIISKEDIEIL
jgi:hypothetical protein